MVLSNMSTLKLQHFASFPMFLRDVHPPDTPRGHQRRHKQSVPWRQHTLVQTLQILRCQHSWHPLVIQHMYPTFDECRLERNPILGTFWDLWVMSPEFCFALHSYVRGLSLEKWTPFFSSTAKPARNNSRTYRHKKTSLPLTQRFSTFVSSSCKLVPMRQISPRYDMEAQGKLILRRFGVGVLDCLVFRSNGVTTKSAQNMTRKSQIHSIPQSAFSQVLWEKHADPIGYIGVSKNRGKTPQIIPF